MEFFKYLIPVYATFPSVFSDQPILENPWGHVDTEDHVSLRHRRRLEERAGAIVREMAHQVAFLALLFAVCYSNQDTRVFQQNDALRNAFLSRIEYVSWNRIVFHYFPCKNDRIVLN